MAAGTADAMVSLENLDWFQMQHVYANHDEHRQRNGVALIGWIGMIVDMHAELCERISLRVLHYELTCIEGLDAWLGFLEHILFYLRIEMRYVELQRSNTVGGVYEC